MGQETREVLLKKRDHVNFNIDKALANGVRYLIYRLIIPLDGRKEDVDLEQVIWLALRMGNAQGALDMINYMIQLDTVVKLCQDPPIPLMFIKQQWRLQCEFYV